MPETGSREPATPTSVDTVPSAVGPVETSGAADSVLFSGQPLAPAKVSTTPSDVILRTVWLLESLTNSSPFEEVRVTIGVLESAASPAPSCWPEDPLPRDGYDGTVSRDFTNGMVVCINYVQLSIRIDPKLCRGAESAAIPRHRQIRRLDSAPQPW